MIVEDNAINSNMLRRRLERRGYQVLVAPDGVRGVKEATNKQPDLVLMDMSLPVMDGWEATRQLTSSPRTSHIPIIALTAHTLPEDRLKAIEVGCSDFESKPVHLNQLMKKIQALMPD
nr:response regulator [Desulfurispira natronophila]